jgi:uncharacterized protein with gpF-like domain
MFNDRVDSDEDEPNDVSRSWTPEQQIAHMLGLCEAQMESALADSDKAVDALIKAFTGLADTTRSMGAAAEQLPEAQRDAATSQVNRQVDAISEQMAAAVVALQFYDKLTQRLGHVRYSLSTLAMFVCDRTQTNQREQWQRLFSTLRRLYRTEEEREIFQLMVEGASADEARAQIEQRGDDSSTRPGDIELF